MAMHPFFSLFLFLKLSRNTLKSTSKRLQAQL
jgi:hypothetical protein